MLIIQIAILLLFLLLGEAIVYLIHIPIPSCILGMLMLAFALHFKFLNLKYIENVANFFVKNLGFFFIPPGVGLMCHFGLLAKEWFPIMVATIISTLLVLWSTGVVHQWLRHILKKHGITGK